MTEIRFLRPFAFALCASLLLSLLTNQAQSAEESTAAVRKPDPRSADLLPVAPEDIKPGKIYNHYSEEYGRYVWAYALPGGGFSYALGVGSTELPSNFDVVTSKRETEELIESQAGPWAERSRLQSREIYVRLGADNRWSIVRGRSIRSHFDLDSSQRWEWHGKRRVAVLHTTGNLWHHDGSRYVPLRAWYAATIPHAAQCGCATCLATPHSH